MPVVLIDTNEFYTTHEATAALHIGYATLYRWILKGKIIPFRINRRTLIPKSEVIRLQKDGNVGH